MEFEELVEQFEPMVWHMVKKLNVRRDREVYFQEGLVAMWRAWELYDEGQGDFAPYLYQKIRGGMLDYMRRENRFGERNVGVEGAFWELCGVTEDVVLEREVVEGYCEELTRGQRCWVLRTFCEGMTVMEVAESEGVSVSAVKKWRSGALERLRGVVSGGF